MNKLGFAKTFKPIDFAIFLKSLGDDLRKHLYGIQHFPCIGEPYSKDCKIDEVALNIFRYIFTEDVYYLDLINAKTIKPKEISLEELIQRVSTFCNKAKSVL